MSVRLYGEPRCKVKSTVVGQGKWPCHFMRDHEGDHAYTDFDEMTVLRNLLFARDKKLIEAIKRERKRVDDEEAQNRIDRADEAAASIAHPVGPGTPHTWHGVPHPPEYIALLGAGYRAMTDEEIEELDKPVDWTGVNFETAGILTGGLITEIPLASDPDPIIGFTMELDALDDAGAAFNYQGASDWAVNVFVPREEWRKLARTTQIKVEIFHA